MTLSPRATQQILLFVTGLMSGILLESRVFHSHRAAQPTATGPAVQSSVATSTATVANSTGRPSISVEEAVHDFGVAETGDKIEHVFVIRNAGSAPLNISQVRAACGCTTADISGRDISPGGSTELKVVLDLRDRKGSQNSVVSVKSNDPDHEELKLSLVGSAVSRITISPPMIDVGRVLQTEPAEPRRIRIQVAQGLDLKINGVLTSSPSLVANVEESAANLHTLAVSVLPGVDPGPLRGWVRVQTDHPNQYREISIPLSGYVGPGGPVIAGDEMDVVGPTLDGGTFDLKSFRGKVSLVVFWASWCGHCQREIPELLALYKQLGSEGLEIVGVNCDEKTEAAKAAVEKWKITWPNIHFAQGDAAKANPLMVRHQIKGIPAIFVVGRDGRVNHVGLRNPVLKVRVEQLVRSKESANSTSD